MLIHLSLQQFITLESLELDFFNGTHLVTGETGAGKSILMHAIEIALGARAHSTLVRQGAQTAEITLIVDAHHHPNILNWLAQHHIKNTESLVYFRRQINAEGRSRGFINGIPMPLEKIKELGKLCAYFQEQFAEQSLFIKDEQRHIVDQFAGITASLLTLSDLSQRWKSLKNQQKSWEKMQIEQTQQLEFLNFQLTELDPLQLSQDTWAELENAHRKQLQHDKYQQLLHEALSHFQLGESHLPKQVQTLRKNLEELNKLDSKYASWIPTLNEYHTVLNDLNDELQQNAQSSELSEKAIAALDEKISTHYQLARKYKLNPEQLFEYYQSLKQKQTSLQQSDTQAQAIASELQIIFDDYRILSQQVSTQRQSSAQAIQKFVNEKLQTLGLPNSDFQIQIQTPSLQQEDTHLPAHGMDQIEFLFKANVDQSLQPLHRAISGGELSRLSLCLHLSLSHKAQIPTLLFDEIDTGMSGKISQEIGRLLKQLGHTQQVFCITHQASVAAYADHHLCVTKHIKNNKTSTDIHYLKTKEREKEIARLLSGNTESSKTLAHAKELLEQVHS